MTAPVIYDFGANTGDDLPYYLKRAERVVAVEANPVLCDMLRARFHAPIAQGRLIIEACAVVTEADFAPEVPFHVHQGSHVLSQFGAPPPGRAALFRTVPVPARLPCDIIRQHGAPHFIKIDLEHYDAAILRHLFAHAIAPPCISAEAGEVEVFPLLLVLGAYRGFKLVDGATVPVRFHDLVLSDGTRHGFPPDSAGPFGDDIPGPWMAPEPFAKLLALEGLGWRDIHACADPAQIDTAMPSTKAYLVRTAVGRLPQPLRRLVQGALRG